MGEVRGIGVGVGETKRGVCVEYQWYVDNQRVIYIVYEGLGA